MSAAIEVEMPDILPAPPVLKKAYDPAMLLRGSVGLGRLLCLLAANTRRSVKVHMQVRRAFCRKRALSPQIEVAENQAKQLMEHLLQSIVYEELPAEIKLLCAKSARSKLQDPEVQRRRDLMQIEMVQSYIAAGMGTWDEYLPKMDPKSFDDTDHAKSFQSLYNKAIAPQKLKTRLAFLKKAQRFSQADRDRRRAHQKSGD